MRLAALALFAPLVLAQSSRETAVTAVRTWPTADGTRIAIEVSGRFEFKYDRLHDPDRAYFDIKGARPSIDGRRLWSRQVADKLVQRIRVAETAPGVTRVVVDLTGAVEVNPSVLTKPYRLMIELRAAAPAAVTPLTESTVTPPVESAKVAEKKPPVPTAVSAGELTLAELARVETSKATEKKAPATSERPAKADSSRAGSPPVESAKVAEKKPPAANPVSAGELSLSELSRVETSKAAEKKPPAKSERPARADSSRAGSPPLESARGAEKKSPAAAPASSGELTLAELPRVETAKVVDKKPPASTSLSGAGPSAARSPAANEAMAPPAEPARIETARVESPAASGSHTALENSAAVTKPNLSAAELAKGARHTSTGSSSLTRALGLKLNRIVLDAGHGGHDQGTSGPKGLLEKDLVLDVTLRLGKLIEQGLGAEVIYTRSDDTFIPLEGRTALANEKKADLFLSIHANSSPVPRITGVETYYLNFTDSKDSMDLAARENAASERSIFELQDLLHKITMHEKLDESREFASRVQAALYAFSARSFPGQRNRGVKKAPFVVLIGAQMPSVLAEIGFLTNSREEQLLKRSDYRQKLAESLYRGVARYAESLSHFQVAQNH